MTERINAILEFNKNLIVALIAAIPDENRMAHMPDPAALITMENLLEAKKLLEMVYEGKPYWPVGMFDTWKGLPEGPAAAAAPKTKTEEAEALLVAFNVEFPHSMSFNYMNPDP